MYPAGDCSERWTSRVASQGLLSFKFQLSLLGVIRLSCPRGASSYFHSKQIRLMCQVLTDCGFSGVSLDGNCAHVDWGSFTSNSRSARRAIWFTWFSEPHECIQHLAVTRRSPIQLWTGRDVAYITLHIYPNPTKIARKRFMPEILSSLYDQEKYILKVFCIWVMGKGRYDVIKNKPLIAM